MSAVIVRFTMDVIGMLAVALGFACLIAVTASYVLASARYRRVHDGLVASGRLLTDGRPLMGLSVALGVISVCAAFFVVGVGVMRF